MFSDLLHDSTAVVMCYWHLHGFFFAIFVAKIILVSILSTTTPLRLNLLGSHF